MDEREQQALNILERIASAVEFLAGMNGHVAVKVKASPAPSEEPVSPDAESANE